MSKTGFFRNCYDVQFKATISKIGYSAPKTQKPLLYISERRLCVAIILFWFLVNEFDIALRRHSTQVVKAEIVLNTFPRFFGILSSAV
jgi:hypothetical protein